MVHAVAERNRTAVCVGGPADIQELIIIIDVYRVKLSPGATLKVDILCSCVFDVQFQWERV